MLFLDGESEAVVDPLGFFEAFITFMALPVLLFMDFKAFIASGSAVLYPCL